MKTLMIKCLLVVLSFLVLLTSVISAPQPGVCYFGDSNGDCVIDSFDIREARNAVLLKPADYSNVIPESSDVQDVDGNGVVDGMDVRILRGLMMLNGVDVKGAPANIKAVNAPVQLDIGIGSRDVTVKVSDNDGTPRAGIGVLFTIDDGSTGTATLTGRDPANGDNIVDSNAVFELTNTIKEGGEATITINPLTTGSLIIRTFIPGDKSKGINDIYGEDVVINIVDGSGTIINNAPVFNAIDPITAYSNELIEFTVGAADADNDGLTYDKVSGPGSFDSETQTYAWTPLQSDKTGSATFYDVVFSASDGVTAVEQSIRITLINRMPEVPYIEEIYIDENGLVLVSPAVSDPDGDALTITYSEKVDSNGRWQTGYDDAGNYEIVVIVSDGVNSVGRSFIINVNDVAQNTNAHGSGGSGSTGSNNYHDYVDVNRLDDEVKENDLELGAVDEIKDENEVTDVSVEDIEEKNILELIKGFFNRIINFFKNLF